MKKLICMGMGLLLCLAAILFTGCEKKPLDETGGGSGGSGGGTTATRGTVEGVVTVKETGKPILLASVALLPTDKLTLTDTAGLFKFSDIEPGTYKLQVKRSGYATYTEEEIKVEAGKTVRCNVALETAQSDLQILDTNGVVISELCIGNSSRGIFLLRNACEAIVEWEIPKLAVDWIAGFSKQSGKLAPGAVDTVMLTIDRSQLSEGSNEAVLYIGSSVGDKKLLITAGMELSFCFTDSYGNEIMDLDMSSVDQHRFKIKNTGSGALTWTVGEIEANWLTFVGERNGQLSAGESESRTLKVDRTRLEEGMHETALIFKTNAGTKSLSVKNNVEMACRLEDEQGVEITELEFGLASSKTIRIKNTGNGVLTWEVSPVEADWLMLGEKKKGSLQPGSVETIDMTIDPSLLTEGDNQTTVNIRTNAGDKQLQVKAYRLQLSDVLPETVYVAGGTFMMGATEEQGSDAGSNESPVHEVTLDGFHIGKYEITQLQWKFIMGTTVEEQRNKTNPSYELQGVGDDYPMYYVNWNEAVEFCEKLSQMTGKTYRLPTEAEWEYAARGGQHADGTKYAGSNTVGDVAWYCGNSKQTHPVGKKKPNGLGLYDMSGNVDEKCSDWYGEYGSSAEINPQGPSSGSVRVRRGGSWYGDNTKTYCRVSSRNTEKSSDRFSNVGFRVVMEP